MSKKVIFILLFLLAIIYYASDDFVLVILFIPVYFIVLSIWSYKHSDKYVIEFLSKIQGMEASYSSLYDYCKKRLFYFNRHIFNSVIIGLLEKGVITNNGINMYKLIDR